MYLQKDFKKETFIFCLYMTMIEIKIVNGFQDFIAVNHWKLLN